MTERIRGALGRHRHQPVATWDPVFERQVLEVCRPLPGPLPGVSL